MAESIKRKQYVPLLDVMRRRTVKLYEEAVYVKDYMLHGVARVIDVEQNCPNKMPWAEIKFIKGEREARVPLSALMLLETLEENKTEKRIMLFKGYKIAVVAPTNYLIGSMSDEPNRAVLGRDSADPLSERCIARYHGSACIDTACYCDVKVGDFVAVINNDKVMTGRVVNVIEDTTVNGINIKGEVLDVIDTTAYADRCQKAVEAENLKRQMDVEVERMKEQAAYDSFAEKNPFLSEMLIRYKSIMGDDTKTNTKTDIK